jgi:hypothetical protein
MMSLDALHMRAAQVMSSAQGLSPRRAGPIRTVHATATAHMPVFAQTYGVYDSHHVG